MSHACEHHTPAAGSILNLARNRRILWVALWINAAMFGVELFSGWHSGSLSLLADSIDFAGDALNYGVSLAVLSAALAWRARAAVVKALCMMGFGSLILGRAIWSLYTGTVPDATTMLRFRRLLNEQKLGEALFARVGKELQARGIKVNTGTIVDATIIGAPSSTKNADKARDPEMHQTRKGQQWYFGMKLHIGVDSQTGLSHSAVVTAANVHDKHPLPDLLHGNEQRVYGDSAYASQKALIASKAPRAKDFTNQRTRRAGEVDEVQRAKNRNKSRVRARVEHVFAVVKRLWGFTKVRYRGLQKNATRAFTALALANIYLCRGHLQGQLRP